MVREFSPVSGPGRIWKDKQLGFPSLGSYSLAGAPPAEPNAKGNADANEEEDFPRVEEPLEEPPNIYNCACISTMPRGSTHMFEDRGNGVTTQLVLARENTEVRAVRVCGVHGGKVMTSNREPVVVGLSLRQYLRKQITYISVA